VRVIADVSVCGRYNGASRSEIQWTPDLPIIFFSDLKYGTKKGKTQFAGSLGACASGFRAFIQRETDALNKVTFCVAGNNLNFSGTTKPALRRFGCIGRTAIRIK